MNKVLLLLGVVLLSGCGKGSHYEGARAVENPVPADGFADETETRIEAISLADADRFASELETILTSGNVDQMMALMVPAVFFKTCFEEKLSTANNAGYTTQLIRSEFGMLLQSMVAGLVISARDKDLTYLGAKTLEEGVSYELYFRFVSNSLYDYYIIRCRVDTDGRFSISDIEESEFLGESLSEFLLSYYEPLIDIMHSVPESDLDVHSSDVHPGVVEFSQAMSNYRAAQALSIEEGGGPKSIAAFYLQDSKYTQNFYAQKFLMTQLMATGGADVDFRRTIERLDRRWPKKLGTLRTLLIHYTELHEYDKIFQWIDKLDARVNGDPAWDIVRSRIWCKQDKQQVAIDALVSHRKELEALEDYYLVLAQAYTGLESYEKVVEVLTVYETRFEKKIISDDFKNTEWMPAFKKSSAGAAFFGGQRR
jgi:hypothetical protein